MSYKMATSSGFTLVRALYCNSKFVHRYSLPLGNVLNNAVISRSYRGSKRDTRRRQRNQMLQINEELRRRDPDAKKYVFDRQTFMLENFEQEIFCLQRRLNIQFQDQELLWKVFNCSSSKLNDIKGNDKLALKGYLVTSLYVTEVLMRDYPLLPFSLANRIKEKILSRKNLVEIAQHLSLVDFIISDPDLPKIHNEKCLPFVKDDVITDCLFAFIGAVAQDKGQEEAENFLKDVLITPADVHTMLEDVEIPKPARTLTEMCELARIARPSARVMYKLAETSSLPVYVVGVYSGQHQIGQSAGPTVKEATESAYLTCILKLLTYNGQELEKAIG